MSPNPKSTLVGYQNRKTGPIGFLTLAVFDFWWLFWRRWRQNQQKVRMKSLVPYQPCFRLIISLTIWEMSLLLPVFRSQLRAHAQNLGRGETFTLLKPLYSWIDNKGRMLSRIWQKWPVSIERKCQTTIRTLSAENIVKLIWIIWTRFSMTLCPCCKVNCGLTISTLKQR